ncbi:MAG: glycoside hydrolase family 2 [Deltaproteobacteria bacterium]|nr:glycoside hydrolase family 2 [Deltaproteobacteria bacterium]
MARKHLTQFGRATGVPPPPPRAAGASGRGYPRPMLERDDWTSLDGAWDFAIDHDAALRLPDEVQWGRPIEVPFSPETARSGIGDTGLYRACWYRRAFEAPALPAGQRLILHLGAVDHEAMVWVDGGLAAVHEGGYTPFSADVTDLLAARAKAHEIVVRAFDDPGDLAKPRGKQDWQIDPHSIWYPRTTGIWQSVWLERVSPVRIEQLRWSCNLERWEIGVDVRIAGAHPGPLRLRVTLQSDDLVLVDDSYTVVASEVHRAIVLSDPGIDDFRNELLWHPSSPKLIDAFLELVSDEGAVLDRVRSYTAIRSIAVDGGRFLLNGRPYPLRMVLDQGYWPDTGLTAPSDDALRRDVELTKAMGFNAARKHQKIEDPRYLYWADRLGLLVWEEMPSAYRFTRTSVARLTREWIEVIERDASHPCIIAWVPFNESWGVPNLPENAAERHYVETLYHLTKTMDPSRPVVGNDGWESVATDLIGIHDYDDDPARIRRRYETHEVLPRLLKRERPGGRALMLKGNGASEHPIILSEFGGIALARPGTWGYTAAPNTRELARRYRALLDAVNGVELLAGFCYTQFADTWQEANGLLYADRTPKFPLDEMCAATRGARVVIDLDPAARGEREAAP